MIPFLHFVCLPPAFRRGGFFMSQSEEIHTFVEEINSFSENHLLGP